MPFDFVRSAGLLGLVKGVELDISTWIVFSVS
jgi:hypothetical protein